MFNNSPIFFILILILFLKKKFKDSKPFFMRACSNTLLTSMDSYLPNKMI